MLSPMSETPNKETGDVSEEGLDHASGDETFANADESSQPQRRQTMRERANSPSDTVGTGSYAAIACSVIAILATALLIAGLLIGRWLF